MNDSKIQKTKKNGTTTMKTTKTTSQEGVLDLARKDLDLAKKEGGGVVSSLKMQQAHPNVWGPRFWFVFHIATTVYPTKPSSHVRTAFFNFILSIPLLLPCKECRNHCMKYISENLNVVKSAVFSRRQVFEFFVNFHNSVNRRRGKPIVTVDEAIELYGYDESEPSVNDILPTMTRIQFSNPDIWGPHYWFFFHTASVHFPVKPTEAMKEAFYNFILVVPLLLPCMQCRKHAIEHIQQHLNNIEKYAIRGRQHAFKFFVDFHNSVNEMKQTAKMPLRLAKNLYGYDEF